MSMLVTGEIESKMKTGIPGTSRDPVITIILRVEKSDLGLRNQSPDWVGNDY